MIQKKIFENGMLILSFVSVLKAGNTSCTIRIENRKEIKVSKKDRRGIG